MGLSINKLSEYKEELKLLLRSVKKQKKLLGKDYLPRPRIDERIKALKTIIPRFFA